MNTHAHAEAYARFFESLTPETSREAYEAVFEPDVCFADPFHRFKGIDALRTLFDGMFAAVEAPAFVVDEIVCSNGVAYLRWEFSYRPSFGRERRHFEGVSRVQFTASGRVSSHIDYWDAARNVYEHLPLVGKVVAFLRARIASS
ncbi:MAG: nuclear transport factor 2 family protein [Campylobacterales bacterium]|jgi:steroid delta-isomerase